MNFTEQELKSLSQKELNAIYERLQAVKKEKRTIEKGFQFKIEGSILTIVVDLSKEETRESKSGKTDLIASGMEKLGGEYKGYSFGLNVFKKKPTEK